MFNYLFIIHVSLHICPGVSNLPWYNPFCNAHLEWLSVFPLSWSRTTSVRGSVLLAGSCWSDILGVLVRIGLLEKQSNIWGDTVHPGCLQVGPERRAGGELHASDSWISTAVLWKSSVLHILHILLMYGYFMPILLSASPRSLDKRRCVGADELCPGGLCGLRTDSGLLTCVTSLRGWIPSPMPPRSVGLLFFTSCLFPPCCQQSSGTH